jgi:hypothetical protein
MAHLWVLKSFTSCLLNIDRSCSAVTVGHPCVPGSCWQLLLSQCIVTRKSVSSHCKKVSLVWLKMTFSHFLKIVAFPSSVPKAIVGSDSWHIPTNTLCSLQQAHSDTFVSAINKHSHVMPHALQQRLFSLKISALQHQEKQSCILPRFWYSTIFSPVSRQELWDTKFYVNKNRK